MRCGHVRNFWFVGVLGKRVISLRGAEVGNPLRGATRHTASQPFATVSGLNDRGYEARGDGRGMRKRPQRQV